MNSQSGTANRKELPSAFRLSFTAEKAKHSFYVTGCVPLNRKGLDAKCVSHNESTDDNDDYEISEAEVISNNVQLITAVVSSQGALLKSLHKRNKACCAFLDKSGFQNVNELMINLPSLKEDMKVKKSKGLTSEEKVKAVLEAGASHGN